MAVSGTIHSDQTPPATAAAIQRPRIAQLGHPAVTALIGLDAQHGGQQRRGHCLATHFAADQRHPPVR